MAATAHRPLHLQNFTQWFPDFLRKELAAYPGRLGIVTRMVIAATLSMILIETFRIPGGAIGALFAFVLSRENLRATAQSAGTLIFACAISAVLVPVGARMFASIPLTHFIWEGVSLFGVFFLLKTMNNYAVAVGFSLIVTSILGIWYLPGPAERNVELTLWQILAATVGALVTVAVEAAFHAMNPQDPINEGVNARLAALEGMLDSMARDPSVSPEVDKTISRFAVVGVGGLRRYVARASYDEVHRMRMNAVVSLTGRSVDLAAAMLTAMQELTPGQRDRAAALAAHLREFQQSLETQQPPKPWPASPSDDAHTFPLFAEFASMVSLMPGLFSTIDPSDPQLQVPEAEPIQAGIFVSDAFSNPEHLRYALSGTLAAMLCYICYTALSWPGLTTSVTTCVLTALTNIGSSRQKQLLRVGGAILGGVVFGMGGQVFVLPFVDTIGGFTIFFVIVTFIASWISTSSSRLSYAGVQVALAFYLVNLGDFTIQTSLTVARDRVIGVLLGMLMMWIAFERLYPVTAADQMVRVFIRNLRLMAELSAMPNGIRNPETLMHVRRQRDQVYRNFSEVNAQADAVPFEGGKDRDERMAARDRVRRWQAQLRAFFVYETPLLQFRIYEEAVPISDTVRDFESNLQLSCSEVLLSAADHLEKQMAGDRHATAQAVPPKLGAIDNETLASLTIHERSVVQMSHQMADVLGRVQEEMLSEPLYG